MAQLQVSTGRSSARVLEGGNIAFLYRPKKAIEHPRNIDDLERAYFLLFPDDRQVHQNRAFDVGHGSFPEIIPGELRPAERVWAFVMAVSSNPRDVVADLERHVRARSAGGQRIRPWARVAGLGRYVIARHGKHTDLAYALSEPRQPGSVQHDLQIMSEASYVLSVKEPFAPSEIQLEQKPAYPDDLRAKFDGHGWIPGEPTTYLDYLWTQVLLIGGTTDVRGDLGIAIDGTKQNAGFRDAVQYLRDVAVEAERESNVRILGPLDDGRWE